MDVLSAMWDSASADLAAEQRAHRLVAAKVSAAEVWPFLALAVSEPEFEHRLALVRDHVTAVVDPDLHDEVVASLREDFRTVAASPARDTADEVEKGGNGRFVFDDDHDNPNRERDGEDSAAGDRDWDRRHKSSLRTATSASMWDALDAAPRHQQHLGSSLDDMENAPPPKKLHKWPDSPDNPDNRKGNEEDPDDGSDDEFWDLYKAQHHKGSLTFFHEASGKWVRIGAATMSPENPNYFLDAHPEQGPNTDPSGYADMNPDPPETALQRYTQPEGAWSDATPWQENPMTFSPPRNGTSGWTTPPQKTSSRTAKAPPMDPRDEETRSHVCIHCGEEEPRPNKPCPENGNYCSGCGGSGCVRCGNAGEVFGTHHIVTGVKRRAEVVAPEGPQNANPGYFDQGTEGITGPGADTSPPPITGNPDAGVFGGGADGNATSEPLEARSDWYGEMTGQADSPDQDGTEGQNFQPQASRRPFGRDNMPGHGQMDDPGGADRSWGNPRWGVPHQSALEGGPVRASGSGRPEADRARGDLGSGAWSGPGRDGRAPSLSSAAMRQADASGAEGARRAQAGSHRGGRALQLPEDGLHPGRASAQRTESAHHAGRSQGLPGVRSTAGSEGLSASSFYDPSDRSVRVTAADMGADMDPMDGGGAPGAAANTPQVDPTGGTNPGQDPNARVPDDVGMSTQAVRDAVRRALAAGEAPAGGGPPPTSGGGQAPAPPPQMQQGGPGAEAMPPMSGQGGQPGAPGAPGAPGGATSNVPQSTKPRQTPGAGGASGAPGAPGGAPPGGGATSGTSPGTPKAGRRVRADARDIATPDNPTGLGDEYDEKANEGAMRQKPMQSAQERNVTTPQKPREPIPTISSPGTPGGGDDEDDEDNTREAVRRAVSSAMAGAR